MAAFGAKAGGELAFLPGTAGEGELAKAFGGGKIEGGAEPAGGVTKEPALDGWHETGEAVQIERYAFGGSAAASANRPAGEEDFGSETGDFGGPPGFFVAGELSHLRQMVTEPRVPGVELGQEFVADAIAGECEVAVAGVFAPVLGEVGEVSLNFGAAGGQQRAQNAAFGELDHGVDAGDAFGPGAAQELGQHGFGLIVERVGGGDGIERGLRQEPAEPGVAETAGGFFDGFGGLAGEFCGFGGGGDAVVVKGQSEAGGEGSHEVHIGVGFGSAQAVMEVR